MADRLARGTEHAALPEWAGQEHSTIGGGDFEMVPLGEVASVRSGFAFKSSDWVDAGIPVVKIGNVKEGNLIMEGCSFVSSATADSASESSLRDGDILIAMTGYIGDTALVRSRDLPAALNQRVGRFSVHDPDRLDKMFLFYSLRREEVREQIKGLGYGSAQPNVSPSLMHSVNIPLPPLDEQRAIAHILETLDDKIELNRRMNETLEAMARAVFRSWFVDFEPVRAKMEGRWRPGQSLPGLPAHLHTLFPDRLVPSELGDIPEGWEVGTLGDVVEQLRDNENPLKTPETTFSHFSIPAYDEGQMPKQELGESIKSVKTLVEPGTVLLSKLNPEIERVWLPDVAPGEPAICSTEFLVLQARPPFLRGYVYCLARSAYFRRQLESLVTGTSKSHQRARANAALALQTIIPEAPVIREFDRQASPALNRTIRYRRDMAALTSLRDTLLPRLVAGELRVEPHEEFTGVEPVHG